MGRAFVKHADAETFNNFANKTFGDVLTAAKDHVDDLTWQELARYNWGTAVPAEVNRILVETVGCTSIDDDPTKTAFNTHLGPGGAPVIRLPKLWKADAVAPNRVHTVRLAKRQPAPAIAITSLTQWFLPKTEKCELKYALQGVSARADKVDFEVHTSQYFARNKDGNLLPSTPHADKSTHLVQTREIFKIDDPKGTPIPPVDAKTYDTWKGKSEATQGILEDKGDTHIDFHCAPYPVLVRFYKDGGDKDAKIELKPFCPCWKAGTIDNASLIVKWEIKGDNNKLVQGQLVLFDKDDTVVLRVGLSSNVLRNTKQYDLANVPGGAFDKATFKQDKMPYRVQIQAHSSDQEENGLAVAVMHTEVRAFAYDKIQLVAFNIEPGTKNSGTQYLGKGTTDEDITKRCDIMTEAIQLASANVNTSPDVLKLFMGPEFYFRGEEGAYPVEKVSSIMDRMIKETGKFEYADWLFVYGTTIAYLRHEARNSSNQPLDTPTVHGPITHEGSRSHATPKVTLDQNGEKTKVDVDAAVLASFSNRVPWVFKQADITEFIESCTSSGGTKYELVLASKKGGLIDAAAEILEPMHPIIAVDHNGPKSKLTVRSKFCKRITTDVKWKVKQGTHEAEIEAIADGDTDGDYVLTLKVKQVGFTRGGVDLIEPAATVLQVDNTTAKTKLKVKAEQARRIGPQSSVVQWRIQQDTRDHVVETATLDTPGVYWLTLAVKDTNWATGDAVLQEPVTSEIFNIALMQRGWPCEARCKQGLLRGLVYKEFVSHIDYIGPNSSDYGVFHRIDGSGRKIEIHNVTNRTVRPTAGSADLLVELPNALGGGSDWDDPSGETHTTGSEINKSGEGGGSVVTFDDIAFGVEICLDHAKNKLHKFYSGGHAKSGDPKVQIQLIPSWGMSIGGGEIVAVDQSPKYGLVFNVDGARCDSVARVYDKTYSCDDHPARNNGNLAGNCPQDKDYYVCTTCNAILAFEPVDCEKGHGPATKFNRCVATRDFYTCSNCGDVDGAAGSCTNGHPAVVRTRQHRCVEPKKFYGCKACAVILGTNPGALCGVHGAGGGRDILHQCAESGCGQFMLAPNTWCSAGHQNPVVCDELFDAVNPNCSNGHNNRQLCLEYWVTATGHCTQNHVAKEVCGNAMSRLGTALVPTAGPVDVPSSHDADYYQKPGSVLVYPVQDIPTPAKVP